MDHLAISHRITQAIADADTHGAALAAEVLRGEVRELQGRAHQTGDRLTTDERTIILTEADHAERSGANGGMVRMHPLLLRRLLRSADPPKRCADCEYAPQEAKPGTNRFGNGG